ncbi:DUF397 domain-containing protein [Amycolatopsis sp. BJA-103]|uniref:DUF397 domain-containing protein n=1 Tax=Amycolatopsis sp. BJA-103 TaxID=1911175 RepID=UPI000C759A8A|nr:DUF397 domain-containing protein [Amycolatopsis sp. BJA-103]PNE13094.1 hypothetical protein B1H26_42435 [Amycolatopsis sp. BJA-103]
MSDDRRGWFVSSYSGENGNCVEVKFGSEVRVRDTKNRPGGELSFSGREWRAFTAHLTTPPEAELP